MGNRKFSELRAGITADPIRAERLERAREEVNRAYDAYQLNLKQLRQAKGLTQRQLATILGISQPEISRIERQTDVYLSTLQSYVAAMGGELKLVAIFGDDESNMIDFSEFAPLASPGDSPTVTVSVQRANEKAGGGTVDLPDSLMFSALEQKSLGKTLKEAAIFVRNRQMTNLASLLTIAMADNVAMSGDAAAAARELGAAGAAARKSRNSKMAELLWRKSLDYDPTNYRSRSALGQLLHHRGRYVEAIENLETVASMDNYASLFLGWSLLMNGIDRGEKKGKARGLDELITAMHRWAYQASPSERSQWLRQVKRLHELGTGFKEDVENLLAFASSNANFGSVSFDDLADIDPGPSPSPQQWSESGEDLNGKEVEESEADLTLSE